MVGGVLDNSIKIKSGGGDYNIKFFDGLKDVTKKINQENNFFIIDKYVHDNFKLVSKKYEKNIVSVLKPNEKIKTLETVEKVASKLVRKGANKHSNIIGIGGGFVQDISQFTSHIYHRGSNLTLIPTTLLSMADSCRILNPLEKYLTKMGKRYRAALANSIHAMNSKALGPNK